MTELVHVISGFKIWNSGLGHLSSYVLFPLCVSLGSLNNYGFLIRKKWFSRHKLGTSSHCLL